jgi:hypothetical protein
MKYLSDDYVTETCRSTECVSHTNTISGMAYVVYLRLYTYKQNILKKLYCHVLGGVRDLLTVLDWMIGFIAHYTFITQDYGQLQRYRFSTHFPVHRYTRTRVLSLH